MAVRSEQWGLRERHLARLGDLSLDAVRLPCPLPSRPRATRPWARPRAHAGAWHPDAPDPVPVHLGQSDL